MSAINRSHARDRPRIAVLSSGLGRVLRGYERFAYDLGIELRNEIDITVFGARTQQGGDRSLRSLSRDGLPARILASVTPRSSYQWEGSTFAASALRALRSEDFDLVHIMDAPVLNVLRRTRSLLRKPKLLFTNGVGMMDPCLFNADHIHQVSSQGWDKSVAGGIQEERMTLLPYPVDVERIKSSLSPSEARTSLGLPVDLPIVLSVAAVTESKRIDHLALQIAPLRDVCLFVVGPIRESETLDRARQVLGDRLFHRTLPFDQVKDAYRAADVFALASLGEGMGISLVEAAIAGLPVIAHDSSHFEWLLEDQGWLVDMTSPSALRDRLAEVLRTPAGAEDLGRLRTRMQERFSWTSLRSGYVEMYENVCKAAA